MSKLLSVALLTKKPIYTLPPPERSIEPEFMIVLVPVRTKESIKAQGLIASVICIQKLVE